MKAPGNRPGAGIDACDGAAYSGGIAPPLGARPAAPIRLLSLLVDTVPPPANVTAVPLSWNVLREMRMLEAATLAFTPVVFFAMTLLSALMNPPPVVIRAVPLFVITDLVMLATVLPLATSRPLVLTASKRLFSICAWSRPRR